MSIDKKTGDLSHIFDDDFEVTYEESVFDDGFEVTYEDDPILDKSELNMDAYKDVLSVLNELDETGSMDYLEANRTRTIDLNGAYEYSNSMPKSKDSFSNNSEEHTADHSKTEHTSKHRGLSSYFEDFFKKHDW